MLMCSLATAGDRQIYVEHKAIHAMVGTGAYLGLKKMGYPKAGVVVALGLGVAKELYDQKHGGKFRGGDVAWTAAPSIALSLTYHW